MRSRPGRTSPLLAGLAMGLALILGGCGAAPPRIGADGIDLLDIPTPAPDPTDFVAGVDHQLLPLTPGSRWEYAVSGGGDVVRRVLEVLSDDRVIAGVSVVGVREIDLGADGGPLVEATRWYAQDAAGNVWLLGAQRTVPTPEAWQAGAADARAGLVLAASPRVGDGYVEAAAPGVEERRVTVSTLTGEVAVPAGDYADVVELRRVAAVPPGEAVTSHAPGVGVVQEVRAGGRVDALTRFVAG